MTDEALRELQRGSTSCTPKLGNRR